MQMEGWTPDYLIGVESIDDQHIELFDKIIDLLMAMKEGKGKEEVIKTLDFLEEYVIKHFDDEEEIQKKSNYPKYKEHHQQHEEFKNVLKRLRNTLETKGSSSNLAIEVQKEITQWWKLHILHSDKDLGNYLSEEKV